MEDTFIGVHTTFNLPTLASPSSNLQYIICTSGLFPPRPDSSQHAGKA